MFHKLFTIQKCRLVCMPRHGFQGWYSIALSGLGDWGAMAKWGCGDAACDVLLMRTGLFECAQLLKPLHPACACFCKIVNRPIL